MRLEFAYTADDLAEAGKLPPLPAPKQPLKFGRGLFGWVLFLGMAVMLFLLMQERTGRPGQPPRPRPPDAFTRDFLLPIAPWVVLFLVIWVIVFRQLRKSASAYKALWESDEQLRMPQTFETGDDGVELSSAAVSTRWKWEAFVGLDETTSLFVLRLPRDLRLIVPKRALQHPGELDAFRETLRSRVAAPTGGFPVLPPQ
jgi:hypothetical protein